MTENEAIGYLRMATDEAGNEEFSDVYKEMCKLAIQALEKQVPKKPKSIDEDYGTFICSNCGHTIIALDDMTVHKNCLMCGQAIDWQ